MRKEEVSNRKVYVGKRKINSWWKERSNSSVAEQKNQLEARLFNNARVDVFFCRCSGNYCVLQYITALSLSVFQTLGGNSFFHPCDKVPGRRTDAALGR